MLKAILPQNRFYAEKLARISAARLQAADGPLESLDDLAELPFTFKDELLSSRHPGDLAANLTFPLDHYTRFHQTSGTRGRPLVVLDTADDWAWWIDCWQFVLDAAEHRAGRSRVHGVFVRAVRRLLERLRRGLRARLPGGARRRHEHAGPAGTDAHAARPTVIFCTPSYALHLAEVAAEHQIDVGDLDVRQLILAGEPGGSMPAIRGRIEAAWQARVLDHGGATEVGPWGYGDVARPRDCTSTKAISSPSSCRSKPAQPAAEGELSELVLTNLGRAGSPIIRYRTGDLVRPSWQHPRRQPLRVSATAACSAAPTT